ncbi:MAG: hypothetical protein R2794_13885 [Chitinophagales bacterium]
MKKLIVSLFLINGIISCSSDKALDVNKQNVSGVWKAADFRADIPNMSPEYQEAGKAEFLSSTYTLNNDNSMEMHSDFYSDGAVGHWVVDPSTKELSMFYEYDTTKGVEKYFITQLSEHHMVLHQDIEMVNGYVELELKR